MTGTSIAPLLLYFAGALLTIGFTGILGACCVRLCEWRKATKVKLYNGLKYNCADCRHLVSAMHWWCGNDDAIRYRGTSIPGVCWCPFWERGKPQYTLEEVAAHMKEDWFDEHWPGMDEKRAEVGLKPIPDLIPTELTVSAPQRRLSHHDQN